MLAKVVTMSNHAPSTPQLKQDTYPTFELRYVTESAEIERPHSAPEYKSGKVLTSFVIYISQSNKL